MPYQRTLDFRGGGVHCQVVPAGGGPPLVCVPGGPGLAHGYLAPLARLADHGIPVVFYDPLGSGRSPRPAEVSWTLSLLVEELEAVRAGLDLPRMHLFAHSGGGFAAIEYVLAHAERVASLILSSTPLDLPTYQTRVKQLIDELGPAPSRAFLRGEHDPALRDVAYTRAYYEYVRRHVCRNAPAEQLARMGLGFNQECHRVLKGGFLLYTGALEGWSPGERLADIRVPVLLTCGRFDVVSPDMCHAAAGRFRHGTVRVFDESSHVQHMEEPEAFVAALRDFLTTVG